MRTCSHCGRHWWRGDHDTCTQRAARAATQQHIDWYQRTGHCGGCGQPGDWCQCTDRHPCGCRDLHVMGSGIGRDATDVYSDTPPIEQETLL